MPEHVLCQNIDFLQNGTSQHNTVCQQKPKYTECVRRCGCWNPSAHLQYCHPMCGILCPHRCCFLEDIENCSGIFMEQFNHSSTIQLVNGIRMPIVGLGTSHSGGYSHPTVVYALKECGYRLIDTAKRYGTEQLIQNAIQESGINRDDLFLISKLWPTDFGYETTKSALRGTLKRLGIEYIDSFLIHWPEVSSECRDKWKSLSETWRSLETLLDEGLCRTIGVSNYTINDLEHQSERASVIPMINQIELHPYQNPRDLRKYCEENKIQIQGYCPLGKGNIVNESTIVEIANKHEKTSAQVLIRWSIQSGAPTIPKSIKEHRVKENFGVFDFILSEDEMKQLNSLHDGRKYIDGSKIKEKIDSKMPDGYKLDILSEVQNRRRQSSS